MFATLENNIEFPGFGDGSFQLSNIPPLVIVKQPEGGYVDPDSDEGLVLTVEAEGGEPPYTYEWYKTAQDEETLEKAKAFMTMMCMLFGKSEEEAKALWADKTMESVSELVGNEQEFHVTEGNFGYYCVVTDSVEQHATSDVARTDKTVSIWIEPSNANLIAKDMTFSTKRRPMSEESRRKRSEALKASFTPERRQQMSERMKLLRKEHKNHW